MSEPLILLIGMMGCDWFGIFGSRQNILMLKELL